MKVREQAECYSLLIHRVKSRNLSPGSSEKATDPILVPVNLFFGRYDEMYISVVQSKSFIRDATNRFAPATDDNTFVFNSRRANPKS